MMSSTDKGATWSRPHQVDSGGLDSNVFPAIVAGDPGRIAMSWYGSRSDDFNDTDALWSEMFAQSVNALTDKPVFTQSRISSGNTPVHAADICQAGTFCIFTNGNRNLADFQSIAVDPCGHAVIVYTDDHAPDAHTVVSRQTAGNSLYARTPSSCVGRAASVPHQNATKTQTRVRGEKQSRRGLAATGLPDQGEMLAGTLLLVAAVFLVRSTRRSRRL
jgi:hypothetical protein